MHRRRAEGRQVAAHQLGAVGALRNGLPIQRSASVNGAFGVNPQRPPSGTRTSGRLRAHHSRDRADVGLWMELCERVSERRCRHRVLVREQAAAVLHERRDVDLLEAPGEVSGHVALERVGTRGLEARVVAAGSRWTVPRMAVARTHSRLDGGLGARARRASSSRDHNPM